MGMTRKKGSKLRLFGVITRRRRVPLSGYKVKVVNRDLCAVIDTEIQAGRKDQTTTIQKQFA